MSTSSGPKRSFEDPHLPEGLRCALLAARSDRPSAESISRVAMRLNIAGAAGPATASIGRFTLLSVAALCMLGGAAVHAVLTHSEPAVIAAPTKHEDPLPKHATPAPEPPVIASTAPETVPITRPVAPPAVRKPRAQDTARAQAASLDPNAELELLRRAQAALTPAPSRALALCAEHAQRFPNGAFQQERELIAIVALANRGERGAADARASQFKRAHPDSVHLPRLEALLRDHKNGDLDAHRGKPAPSRPAIGE